MAARSIIPDLSGRVVKDGQYQLVKLLGSGAYGVVYGALDLSPQDSSHSASSNASSRVAIKVLRKADLSSSAAQRVRREVATHRVMSSHPNIVRMHEAFEDRDFVYIVLDYCPGGDLFGKIVDEKKFFRNDELTKSVFLQLLDAVEACHLNGFYHRDLKPENILTSKDGLEIFLADFGLSTGTKLSHTYGCGSSYYMSPGACLWVSININIDRISSECIGKETAFMPYSNRSNDVWALGVLLVNMVTSRSPWNKATTSDDCFSDFLLHENYLREMLPISKGANALFRKIFRWDPRERITIPALRKAILKLDTFFMTDDEIACAGESVRTAASYCGVHIQSVDRAAAKARAVKATTPPHTLALQADDAVTPRSKTSVHLLVDGDLAENTEPSLVSDTSSSSAMSSEPVTPCTPAQDTEVEIPELDITDSGRSLWRRVWEKAAPRSFGFNSSLAV